ncbi:RNA polymerase sigma-70 factor (ECF subfamily) [Anseongella ginsenosidimutans]|uniref:RNA polymerase sigma-70 factor (ECF subfamily) n=1 Tax=Anseongella ginsenosidimutans TaxID=496056 RepID=A0A4R3KN26_9SPHI|nr:RNA polymerase sigma-70 factor (ECF subfamily) [Anseongella ginsenosidimutans]
MILNSSEAVDNHSDDEAGLVSGVIDGDERAFARVYEKYHRHLYFFALKFVKSEELAGEVVHDVFLKVWENRRRLNKELSFRGYLLTICKNHVLNLLKRASMETSIKAEILRNCPPSHVETEDSIHYEDYYQFALRAIEQLPPQRQLVFKMCRIEGRSYDEVAAALGISKGTVRDHLFKGSRYVKEYLSVHAGITLHLTSVFLLMLPYR